MRIQLFVCIPRGQNKCENSSYTASNASNNPTKLSMYNLLRELDGTQITQDSLYNLKSL